MTLDLSKAKKGWKVRFRCGGEADIEKSQKEINGYWLHLLGNFNSTHWFNGGYFFKGEEHIFDIIELIPPAFDWKDVKPGMAFKKRVSNPDLCYFACKPLIEDTEYVGVFYNIEDNWYLTYRAIDLIRSPEHDIEVKP